MESTPQTLTDRLLKCTQTEILTLEREVSFPAILNSSESSVRKLRQENFDGLNKFVIACASHFLSYAFPNQINLAPLIASDLIETREAWKAADFLNLFKFVRQNQDKEELRVFGNQLTILKFMELVSVYEEHRAIALEELHEKRKSLDRSQRVSTSDNSIKSIMYRELEQIRAQNKPTKHKELPDKTYFEKP